MFIVKQLPGHRAVFYFLVFRIRNQIELTERAVFYAMDTKVGFRGQESWLCNSIKLASYCHSWQLYVATHEFLLPHMGFLLPHMASVATQGCLLQQSALQQTAFYCYTGFLLPHMDFYWHTWLSIATLGFLLPFLQNFLQNFLLAQMAFCCHSWHSTLIY